LGTGGSLKGIETFVTAGSTSLFLVVSLGRGSMAAGGMSSGEDGAGGTASGETPMSSFPGVKVPRSVEEKESRKKRAAQP
jgi:hypothetical protein